MNHVSLSCETSLSKKLEFSHFDFEAQAGHWKKENPIQSNSIKINLFIEGDFSMYMQGTASRMVYGEICVFAPKEIHRANVSKQTRICYYQLDIGENCFDAIIGGKELIRDIIANQGKFLLIPENQAEAVAVFEKIESAIKADNKPLAYALVLEFLIYLRGISQISVKPKPTFLSHRTAKIITYLESHYAQNVSISEIAEINGVSTSFLSRSFKKDTGMGVHEYLITLRLAKALELLKDRSVTEAGYMCGFSDSSHFIAVFKERFGVTPKAYKRINGYK